ncbi:cell wall hydrolase [Altererythrobacter aquiaggeris]|uniref:cell wall hydrolase n=1 Tax=Aestuarierythrobacter aquiaggeris TaxID=1898396 RepID=UPI003018FC49
MSRKTKRAGVVAVAATLITTFALSESSGVAAEAADSAPAIQFSDPEFQGAANQAFISEELVQPLPAGEPATETEAGAQAADSDQPAPANAGSLRELVSETTTSGKLSSNLHCLASAVYFESRGEPLDGQLAVAAVIINRADNRQFPSDYCGVVTQRSQFSFVKGGRIPAPRTGSSAWRKAKAIATIAHEGTWQSEAGDSLYFHATYVKPRWARTKTARATIRTHVFYR